MKKVLLTVSIMIYLLNLTAMTSKEKAQVQKTQERIAEAEARIETNKLKEKKLVNTLFEKADAINAFAIKVRKAELSLGGLSSLGAVEQMRIKAERYAIEKKSRKKLQQDFEDLYTALYDWKKIKEKIKEDEEVLKLREVIETLEKKRVAAQPQTKLNQEQYENYTLPDPSTLEEISTLKLNTPTKWQVIYDANVKQLKKLGYDRPSPDIEVPAKITLIIPNQPEMFNDATYTAPGNKTTQKENPQNMAKSTPQQNDKNNKAKKVK